MKPLVRTLRYAAGVAGIAFAAKQTPLDRFIQAPDSDYRYELVKTIQGEGYPAYVLDMTSQQWRTAAEVDHPIWKHRLTVIKPNEMKGTTGFLFITGGSVNDKVPERADGGDVDTCYGTATASSAMSLGRTWKPWGSRKVSWRPDQG